MPSTSEVLFDVALLSLEGGYLKDDPGIPFSPQHRARGHVGVLGSSLDVHKQLYTFTTLHQLQLAASAALSFHSLPVRVRASHRSSVILSNVAKVDEEGRPHVDTGHMVHALNKLDAGSDEQLLLGSGDGATLLVVTCVRLDVACPLIRTDLFVVKWGTAVAAFC